MWFSPYRHSGGKTSSVSSLPTGYPRNLRSDGFRPSQTFSKIRDGQRSEEELIPRASLPSGAAHLAAALRYAERNIAEGKCAVCPKPLDRNSVRYCTRHLTIMRLRKKPKGAKGELPGAIAWLYSNEPFESAHG